MAYRKKKKQMNSELDQRFFLPYAVLIQLSSHYVYIATGPGHPLPKKLHSLMFCTVNKKKNTAHTMHEIAEQ